MEKTLILRVARNCKLSHNRIGESVCAPGRRHVTFSLTAATVSRGRGGDAEAAAAIVTMSVVGGMIAFSVQRRLVPEFSY